MSNWDLLTKKEQTRKQLKRLGCIAYKPDNSGIICYFNGWSQRFKDTEELDKHFKIKTQTN